MRNLFLKNAYNEHKIVRYVKNHPHKCTEFRENSGIKGYEYIRIAFEIV